MDNEFSVNEFGFNESKLTQNLTTKGDSVMRILALDLGKYKSVACEYEAESGQHSFAALILNTFAAQAFGHDVNG